MFLFPGPSKILLTTRVKLKRPGGTGSHFPALATGKPSDKIQGIDFFSTVQPVLEKHDATSAWNTGPPKIQHQLAETWGPVFFLQIRSNPELPLLKGFDRQVQPFQKQFLTKHLLPVSRKGRAGQDQVCLQRRFVFKLEDVLLTELRVF